MVDRAKAASLNATEKNITFEEVTEKYSSQGLKNEDLWNKIAEASMRSRASVNAGLGVDPQAPELPPMPGGAGPSGPGVPLPEVPAPEPPPPPVLEAPPVPRGADTRTARDADNRTLTQKGWKQCQVKSPL